MNRLIPAFLILVLCGLAPAWEVSLRAGAVGLASTRSPSLCRCCPCGGTSCCSRPTSPAPGTELPPLVRPGAGGDLSVPPPPPRLLPTAFPDAGGRGTRPYMPGLDRPAPAIPLRLRDCTLQI